MARGLATARQGSLKLSFQVISGPLLLHEPFLSRGLSGTRESDFLHGSSGLLKLQKLKLPERLELSALSWHYITLAPLLLTAGPRASPNTTREGTAQRHACLAP